MVKNVEWRDREGISIAMDKKMNREGGFLRYLLASAAVHAVILGLFGAFTADPFGGTGDRVIVVNLVGVGTVRGIEGRSPARINRKGKRKAEGARLIPDAGTPPRASAAAAQKSSSVPESPRASGEANADAGPAPGISPSGTTGPGAPGNPYLFSAGGLDKVPSIIEYAEVEYPPEARRGIVEGEVIVKILISRGGRVEAAEVMRSSAKVLEDAVLKAVRQWRFEPPTVRGRPVELWMITPFRFKLK